MKNSFSFRRLSVFVIAVCAVLTVHAGTNGRAKLIDLSWSNPTVEFLSENIRRMEEQTPLDGVIIRVGAMGEKNGAPWRATSENAFGKTPFKYEWFKEQVAMLKAVDFKKFTDNFLYCVVSPGDQDWLSEADWNNLCNNYAIMARIAKEGGLKGIFFDPEQYSRVFWDAGTLSDKSIPFSELAQLAERRGRDWGKAIFSEFPDMVLFLAFFIHHEPSSDLRIPFFKGVLEVLPPEAIIIDSQEGGGYGMRNPQDLDRMAVNFYNDIPKALPEHLHSKFFRQVKFSSAFYLDAYVGTSRAEYTNNLRPDIDQAKSRPDFLRHTISTALNLCAPDSYIMFYGERGAWWSGSPHHEAKKTWEEKMPGITRAVECALDPGKFQGGPELLGKSAAKPYFWQNKYSTGRQTGDFKAAGVTQGSFTCVYPMQGKNWVLLRCDAKNLSSEGVCALGVAFKDAFGTWNFHEYYKEVPFKKSKDWTHLDVPCYVPEGTKEIVVTVKMTQFLPDEEVEFRNLQLFEF